ncbi:hypothetical protein M408DRAFT_64408 [Serendipita vermifera MAFF 305830]|uniref:25S rRNA (uridine-N(3))-methyltransferase BMT5-like domain-containing protein n=1 Tax=Serendipita vermifera MAFF 305830 TaxID=933852 RepID=A0A0C3BJT5_SERVB|nr:hypothetical protein M408DRAFT_64408 [Serendipita vermifera MAFF 305830]
MESQKVAVKKAHTLPKVKPVIPYSPLDTVLLVGEGDFSFANSLVSAHNLPPKNITATSYDSEATCYEKYPWCQRTVDQLKQQGMKILFNVDAKKLGSIKDIKSKQFTKIAFNFPHTGKGITDQDRNILSNQELLVDFFKSTASLLTVGSSNVVASKKRKTAGSDDSDQEDVENVASDEEPTNVSSSKTRGTVLVTLRDAVPYTLWKMPELAKKPSAGTPKYKQLRSFAFHPQHYPGYAHRRTAGHRGEREIPVLKEKDGLVNARTWEFELASQTP